MLGLLKKKKFHYFWLRWLFIAGSGLSLVVASRGCSSLLGMGFSLQCLSCCGAQALDVRASAVSARRLSVAHQLRPELGMEPMSPALAGRLLITVSPGKSAGSFLEPTLSKYC